MKKKQKRVLNRFDDIWIELGIKSFARFHALDIEEVEKIASNPNEVFYTMLAEMRFSLGEYQDFMVKIKKMEVKEKLTRLDFLDL